jgi:hypothetical protein
MVLLLGTVAACGCTQTTPTPSATQSVASAGEPTPAPAAPAPLDGLWRGSWGGGERDGVVFQPVIAELLVGGDRIEWRGFRGTPSTSGTVHIDREASRLRVVPDAAPDGPQPAAIELAYDLADDRLTLTEADGNLIVFERHPTVADPLGSVQVVLVLAGGIDEAGVLEVTEFISLLAGQRGDVYYQPMSRKLSTADAAILRVQPKGVETISLDEARTLLRDPTPVAIVARDPAPALAGWEDGLWRYAGPPPPDDPSVGRMLARVLVPGTVVFILPPAALVPQP